MADSRVLPMPRLRPKLPCPMGKRASTAACLPHGREPVARNRRLRTIQCERPRLLLVNALRPPGESPRGARRLLAKGGFARYSQFDFSSFTNAAPYGGITCCSGSRAKASSRSSLAPGDRSPLTAGFSLTRVKYICQVYSLDFARLLAVASAESVLCDLKHPCAKCLVGGICGSVMRSTG